MSEALRAGEPSPTGQRKVLSGLTRGIPGAVSVGVLILVLWEAGTRVFSIPEIILPAPSRIVSFLVVNWDLLLRESLSTIYSVVTGFLIGGTAGFLLAIGITYLVWFRRIVYPFLVTSQVVPKIALAPLFIIWFGYGYLPKIVITALICFFPVVINTAKGLGSVEQELLQYMRSLGASSWEIFWKISLPWSMPYLFAALKISSTLAVIGANVGEFVGSDVGLGFYIVQGSEYGRMGLVFAAITMVCVIGVLFFLLIAIIEKAVLRSRGALEGGAQTEAAGA
ncbi:MAG: ABC transporter permease [Nitrospinota bacterium]